MSLKLFLFFLLLGYQISLMGQNKFAQGFFTSEAQAISIGDNIIISIKKYNPTKEEIKNASHPSQNGPMNYLMLPFNSTDISLYDKGFESGLYCLNQDGSVKWNVTLGYSNKSIPSPLKKYNEFIYSGEGDKNEDKVIIRKIDSNGKTIWKTEMDSLHNVNDIYIDSNRVSVLVSFDSHKRIDNNDSTFFEKEYPVYYFVQLDMLNGKIIKKEYQYMANFLSSKGFENPVINTDYSYYLNTKDSVAFIFITKPKTATIVSEDVPKENIILGVAAKTESYYIQSVQKKGKQKEYKINGDLYGVKKKYVAVLPVTVSELKRSFIYNTSSDDVLSVLEDVDKIYLVNTNSEGKSLVYKEIPNNNNPVLAAGFAGKGIFILQMDGRNKLGMPGQIKLNFY